MVSPGKDATQEVASDNVPKKENIDAANHESPHQSPANGVGLLKIEGKGSVVSVVPDKAVQGPDGAVSSSPAANGVSPLISDVKASDFAIVPWKVSQVSDGGVTALQSNQEGSVSSLTSEKALRTPEANSVVLQSPGYEGSTSPRVQEKPLEDGYNWRKYGQKLVRGNVYVRSYYRCTHPKCSVKRQVERSQNGQITDTVYFGHHDHSKPQLNTPLAVGFAGSAGEEKVEQRLIAGVEDKPLEAHGTDGSTPKKTAPVDLVKLSKVAENEAVQGVLSLSNRTRDGDPDPKRQKKEKHYGNSIPVDRPTTEMRVVQTMNEVETVDDGYRWRKYGQKLVKGNPNPRSYYRCSNPGCPVKKHVERATNDTKVVIATYEGQHDHGIPPLRTITFHTAKSNLPSVAPNGDSRTKIKGRTVGTATIAYTSPDHESKLIEQPDTESKSKPGTIDVAASEMDVDTELGPERKANEQLIGKEIVQEEGDPHKTIVCRAIKLQNGESGSIPSKQEIRKAKTEAAQA